MEHLEKCGITDITVVSASFSCDKCHGVYQIGGLEYNTCTCMNRPIRIPKLEGRLAEILEIALDEFNENPDNILWGGDPLTEKEHDILWNYIDMIKHICLPSNQSSTTEREDDCPSCGRTITKTNKGIKCDLCGFEEN